MCALAGSVRGVGRSHRRRLRSRVNRVDVSARSSYRQVVVNRASGAKDRGVAYRKRGLRSREVCGFASETYALRMSSSFQSRLNLRVFQCDIVLLVVVSLMTDDFKEQLC